jgi:16S rRNA (guanine966-N2)-methyltransferase
MLGSLHGAHVMDLYAGSGAVGLEALSRGASHAVLVENSAGAIRAIRANIAALGLAGAQLVADRVERVLVRGPAALPAALPAPPAALPAPPLPPASSALPPVGHPAPPAGLPAPPAALPAPPAGRPAPAESFFSKDSQVTPASVSRFGFVFADPPYAMEDGEVAAVLRLLRERGWLAGGALVAVERASGGDPLEWPAGYVGDRARRYGDATLWYGLAAGV